MARLEPYLVHPLAEAVGWALLHALWQGALVALSFAGGLMLLRRRGPQSRYLLGCAVLVLLIVLPIVTGTLLYNPSVEPLPGSEPQARTELSSSASLTPTQAEGAAPAGPAPTVLPASPLPVPLVARTLDLLGSGAPWLAGFWLVGVVLLLLRLCGQALYVQRFRARFRTPADGVWQTRAGVLAARLGVGRPWRLVQSGQADSPLTLGVLRPLIVLPTSALTGMPASQLEALLAHELAHIRRHDYLVNLAQCMVEVLLFYHPAVWWVSGEVRRAREECCDDIAVSLCGDAKLYAWALTNLEGLRQQQPGLALAANDTPLLTRVRRLLSLQEARHTPPLATGAFLLLMVAATAAVSFAPLPVVAQNADETGTQPNSLWVSVSLGVAFDDAYTRISKLVLPNTSYVLVEERTATDRRAVRVTRGVSDTDLVYTYTVNGEARPFDQQARAWFDAALEEGALEPLRQHALKRARDPERRGAWLATHLSYDREADRYVSFARTDDVALTAYDNNISASRIDAGGFDQLTHYAAHDLVPDSEMGSYLGRLIQSASAAQLETLTPSITLTVAEMEDEAVMAEVVEALETRLRDTGEQREPKTDSSLSAPVSQPGVGTAVRSGVPTLSEGVATGRVEWHNTPLADVKVDLRTHRFDDETCCEPQRTLRTTATDENGEFRFEGVPTGIYTLRAVPPADTYQMTERETVVYPSYGERYLMLRVQKYIEAISPDETTGVGPTPTLRWKPFPGAESYEVTLYNVVSGNVLPLYNRVRTTTNSLKVETPLEPDTLYGWSVAALSEYGVSLASSLSPRFSTSPKQTQTPVAVPSLGVRTVLFDDWEPVAANIFERRS